MGKYLGTLFNKKNQPKDGLKKVTFYIRNIVCKITSIRSKWYKWLTEILNWFLQWNSQAKVKIAFLKFLLENVVLKTVFKILVWLNFPFWILEKNSFVLVHHLIRKYFRVLLTKKNKLNDEKRKHILRHK